MTIRRFRKQRASKGGAFLIIFEFIIVVLMRTCSEREICAVAVLLTWQHTRVVASCTSVSFVLSKGSFDGQGLTRKNTFAVYRKTSKTLISMRIRVGIVGLPNVGKSTLFNALARKSVAAAENYPFCTIDPNIAPIPIPDPNLVRLCEHQSSSCTKTISATMDWIDMAGLAKGAHRGEGLGNYFLGTLRECNALCHVVRDFQDSSIVHVEGNVEPPKDIETINTELQLADMEHVKRRLEKKTCIGLERETLEFIADGLDNNLPARHLNLTTEAMKSIKSMGLLTLKPVLYCFNIDEIDFLFDREGAMSRIKSTLESIKQGAVPEESDYAIVCASLDSSLSQMTSDEQLKYLEDLGLEFSSEQSFGEHLPHNVLPSGIMKLLDLAVAYTGPGVPPERSKTTKSYLFRNGELSCYDLAGRLHGDIQKGFLHAEVIPVERLLEHTSFTAAKDSGQCSIEGKDYFVRHKDVVLIKWKGG